jgi:hypothetical protein
MLQAPTGFRGVNEFTDVRLVPIPGGSFSVIHALPTVDSNCEEL